MWPYRKVGLLFDMSTRREYLVLEAVEGGKYVYDGEGDYLERQWLNSGAWVRISDERLTPLGGENASTNP